MGPSMHSKQQECLACLALALRYPKASYFANLYISPGQWLAQQGKSTQLPRCIKLANKLSTLMATEKVHMSYLLGGRSWLRALL